MKTSIIVRLEVEGVHRWPECPLTEVAFLKHRHRHNFHVRCIKRVDHSDRQVEIILFKREILKSLGISYGVPCDFGRMSCEDIAAELFRTFSLEACEVSEDGENGAIVSS